MRMQSTMMPIGSATLLLLALCTPGSKSFQTPSPLTTSSRSHHHVVSHPSPTRSIHQPLFASDEAKEDTDATATTPEADGPDILQPYLPALDPNYSSTGPIGQSDFIISRAGPPKPEELTNEQMLSIIKITCTDLEVNTLVWKCLGYRFDESTEEWSPTEVFPKWKERFPDPPDFIGMKRVYSREVDVPSLRANQALVRSIPADNKQSLKTSLKPLGWTGFQYKELTPNKTRRAQCANWLVFFREELFGYTIEELKERRQLKQAAEAAAEAKRLEEEGETGDEWKLPVTEVF